MKLERRGDTSSGGEPEKQEPEKPVTDERREKTMRKRELAVLGYMGILFLAAAALIVLTYFMQRGNSDTIADITKQHAELQTQALDTIESLQGSYDELQKENSALEKENTSLQNKVDSLTDDITELNGTVSQLEETNRALEDELAESDGELTDAQNDLTEETQKRGAVEALLRLYNETVSGDVDRETLEEAEELSRYLDDEFMTLYQQILTQMEGEGTDD